MIPISICMKRRRPQNLQDLCLQAVVNDFEKVVSRPGSKAGMRVLQRSSQLLLKKLTAVPCAVHRLIALFCVNQYLKELNLELFHQEDIPRAVQKLATVENALTVLTVPKYISLNVLWQVVRVLPETLQCLRLQSTGCVDCMLEVIRERCPNVKELSLTWCREITNAGVYALCRKDEQENVCSNLILEKLYLRGTNVNDEGVVFALQNFKNLSEIDCHYLCDVVCEWYKTVLQESSPNINTLNLKAILIGLGISVRYLGLGPQSPPFFSVLKAYAVFCPFVTKLNVAIYTQEELDACMQFRLLEDVHFIICGCFDFFAFLETSGKTLKRLTLIFSRRKKSVMPAESLILFCPELEYLHLTYVTFAAVKTKSVFDMQCTMPHLKVLHIESESDYLEESLMLLLSCSPNLVELTFINESNFTPASFLSSLINNIHMSALETLKMVSVYISKRLLLQAMHDFKDVMDDVRMIQTNKDKDVMEKDSLTSTIICHILNA